MRTDANQATNSKRNRITAAAVTAALSLAAFTNFPFLHPREAITANTGRRLRGLVIIGESDKLISPLGNLSIPRSLI